MAKNSWTVSFIGSGNVATRLAQILAANRVCIKQIYSRTMANAETLARLVQAQPIDDLHRMDFSADLIIISISDDAYPNLVAQLPHSNTLLAHTAGAIPMQVLQPASSRIGVFYPLQTLNKLKEVDFAQVPFCIEANNPADEDQLLALASLFSANVQVVNSAQREQLHVASVFACNFSNLMYAIAEDLTQQHNINFSLLKPLIKETAMKIDRLSPAKSQTGPASRGDHHTIAHHLELLNGNSKYQQIYALLSDYIIKHLR